MQTDEIRAKKLRYLAWHRGTKEADLIIGGFFDRDHPRWNADQWDWFEALLAEEDHDILAWACGLAPAPERYRGPMLAALQRLDFVPKNPGG